MTVNSTARKQDFAGGQGVLTYTFSSTPSHPEYLKVTVKETATEIETELVYNDTYTVVQAGDGVGGTVTVSPSFSTAYTQTVWRDTEKKQESDYDDYNQFPADTLERDLDRLMFLTQEMAEDIGRAIVNPITEDDPLTLEDIQDIADDAEASAVIATSEATTATTQAGIATAQATIATSEATTCIAGVASVNLPIIGAGDATKILRVNSGGTAYELAALELATSAEAIAGTEAANLMTPSLTTIAMSAASIAITALSDDETLVGTSATEVVSEGAIYSFVTTSVADAIDAIDTTNANYIDGTVQDAIAVTERSTSSTSYVKLKQLTNLPRQGTISVQFQLKNTGGTKDSFARVYVNDIAVGSEQTTTSSSYATKTVSGITVALDDEVSVYCKQSGGNPAAIQNVKILCNNPTLPLEVSGY